MEDVEVTPAHEVTRLEPHEGVEIDPGGVALGGKPKTPAEPDDFAVMDDTTTSGTGNRNVVAFKGELIG